MNHRRTPEQRAAAKAAAVIVLKPLPFRGRGFSARTIKALLDCGIDEPERLLFMTPAQLAKIPGVGKASLGEILQYRKRFIPENGGAS